MSSKDWANKARAQAWTWGWVHCLLRCERLTHLPPQIFLSGIFSKQSENHVSWFASANVVYIGYCSGDGYVGDTAQGGLQFRGKRIVTTAISALAEAGLGSAAVTHVLFGGCAPAGIFYLDMVKALVQGAAQKTKKAGILEVAGMFDSVLWVPIHPPQRSTLPLVNATRAGAAYFNVSGNVLSSACAASMGEARPARAPLLLTHCESRLPAASLQADAWRCLLPTERLPFVETPYLLNAPQFDRGQLAFYDLHPGRTKKSVAFADECANPAVLGKAFQPELKPRHSAASRLQRKTLKVLDGLPTKAQRASFVFRSESIAQPDSLPCQLL